MSPVWTRHKHSVTYRVHLSPVSLAGDRFRKCPWASKRLYAIAVTGPEVTRNAPLSLASLRAFSLGPNQTGLLQKGMLSESSSGHILTNEDGQLSEKMSIWVSSWGVSQGKRQRGRLMPQVPLAQR